MSIFVLLVTVYLAGCSFGAAPSTHGVVDLPGGEAANAAVDAGQVQPAQDATVLPSADSPITAPLPTTSIANGPLVYSGYVGPIDQITVVSEVDGQVLEMNVGIVDKVSAGQTLLTIDSTELEAKRAHSLASLQAAQTQIELLQLQASESDIEAARAEVAAAEAIYRRTLEGPTEEELNAAEADLFQAEAALRLAQAAYDQLAWNPLIAVLPENAQLQEATAAHEAAQAHYDQLVSGQREEVIAAAYAALAAARAHLQRLENGPEEAEIRAAQAQVRQAETALYLAQLQLDQATVHAPVDGIVAEVYLAEGEMAQAGSPVLLLFTPEVHIVLAAEENRLSELYVGQPVLIQANAYPQQTFTGTLATIASQVDPNTRTVTVTVRVSEQPGAQRLLPGMVAYVEFLQE